MERRVVDNVDLRKSLKKGRHSQEAAHDSLRIAIAAVKKLALIDSNCSQRTYRKHSPQMALIALVKRLPLRPRNLAIVCLCSLNVKLCDLRPKRVSKATNAKLSKRLGKARPRAHLKSSPRYRLPAPCRLPDVTRQGSTQSPSGRSSSRRPKRSR
jgi:hypothetical protein